MIRCPSTSRLRQPTWLITGIIDSCHPHLSHNGLSDVHGTTTGGQWRQSKHVILGRQTEGNAVSFPSWSPCAGQPRFRSLNAVGYPTVKPCPSSGRPADGGPSSKLTQKSGRIPTFGVRALLYPELWQFSPNATARSWARLENGREFWGGWVGSWPRIGAVSCALSRRLVSLTSPATGFGVYSSNAPEMAPAGGSSRW